MTLPLIALAILSVVGGLVNTPFRLGLEHFLEPSFEGVQVQEAPTDWLTLAVLAGLSTLAALAGAGAGILAYNRPRERWRRFEESFDPLWGSWEQAYGVDDLYGRTLVAAGSEAGRGNRVLRRLEGGRWRGQRRGADGSQRR